MNNKFQAILVSIFIGHISAMGCSPAFYPGGASYTVGTSVSQSVATINPLVWTSCTIGGVDCLTGWKKTGGVATTVTHNYVCNSLQWCNIVGYAPGGVYSDLAWTKEAVACSGTQTLAPTATVIGGPAGAVTPLPGCPAAWVSGTTYVAGAMVSAYGKSFQCHAHPMSLFCGQYQYEPGTALYGKFYKLAWTEVGPCDDKSTIPAVVSPGSASSTSCPIDEWMFGVEYIAGSLASKNGQVLKCKTEAVVKYCRQVGFEPFSTKYGGAWMQAWEVIGPCVATAPPPATGGLAPPGVAPPTITTFADAVTTSSTSTSTTATYTSDRSGSVPDNSDAGLTRPIAVNLPQGAAIKKISVTVNMIHSVMRDMVINLKAPNGKVLNLFNKVDGVNMVDTVISSTGTAAFNGRIASFTDTYSATAAVGVGPTGYESNVVNFDDMYATPSGDWILALRDTEEEDSGTLTGWEIAFEFD